MLYIIRVSIYFGSGQFSTVNQGVWLTPNGFAIMTFNDKISEEESQVPTRGSHYGSISSSHAMFSNCMELSLLENH